MTRRFWVYALTGILCVFALAGCDQTSSTLIGEDGTAAPSFAAKTAAPVEKTAVTKSSANANSIPTTTRKTSIGSSTGPIAYSVKQNGTFAIYVMNADGSDSTRLTDASFSAVAPSWSPDGKRIVFSSDTGSTKGTGELYIINADGSGMTRLTHNEFHDYAPAWSPDGSKIVFGSNRDGKADLYVINVDGSGETQLTTQTGIEIYPAWSPDGKKIVFCSDRDVKRYEIYLMNADGSDVQRLTNNEDKDSRPMFSPNGSKIAYISDRDGHGEVYVMNADGSQAQRLTNNETNKVDYQSWSADGKYILYTSPGADGVNREIYIINADGTNPHQLTDDADDKSYVTWAPKSK